jgi:hypothetical protein
MCVTTIERGGRHNILGKYDWDASHLIERNRTCNEDNRNLFEDVRIYVFYARGIMRLHHDSSSK